MLTDALIVEEDLVDRERNVVFRLELDDVAHLFRRYFRNLHFLDDQLTAAHGDGAAGPLQSGTGDRASDGLDDGAGVLDRAIRDGILGEGGHTQGGQSVGPA